MSRRFIETYIAWNDSYLNSSIFLKIVNHLKDLGYHGLSIVFPVNNISSARFETLGDKLIELKRIANTQKIDLVFRAEIRDLRPYLAKKILRKIRKKFELISMAPTNREQTVFACRDGRVDIITLLPDEKITLYKGDISNIKREGKIVELLITPLRRVSSPRELANKLYSYRRILYLLKEKKISFIISTGAYEPEEVPDPYSKAALLEILGGFNTEEALNALSRVYDLIDENRKKLSGKMPVKGVEVLEE